jgi:hypothetical protein
MEKQGFEFEVLVKIEGEELGQEQLAIGIQGFGTWLSGDRAYQVAKHLGT